MLLFVVLGVWVEDVSYVEAISDFVGIFGISLNVVVVSASVGHFVVLFVVLILPIKYIEPNFYLDKEGVIYHLIFHFHWKRDMLHTCYRTCMMIAINLFPIPSIAVSSRRFRFWICTCTIPLHFPSCTCLWTWRPPTPWRPHSINTQYVYCKINKSNILIGLFNCTLLIHILRCILRGCTYYFVYKLLY